jgi:hypothetical protein
MADIIFFHIIICIINIIITIRLITKDKIEITNIMFWFAAFFPIFNIIMFLCLLFIINNFQNFGYMKLRNNHDSFFL